jgi:hypothetical protein
MSYAHKLFTVTSSGNQALSTAAPSTEGLITLLIQVTSGTVYLGSSAVSTSAGSGYAMTTASTPVTLELGPGEPPPYGVTSTSAGISVLWRKW